jgi:hypothetical protein
MLLNAFEDGSSLHISGTIELGLKASSNRPEQIKSFGHCLFSIFRFKSTENKRL